MPKYDGASASKGGYTNKFIDNRSTWEHTKNVGRYVGEKVRDSVKEVFPAENPMMGSKKENAINDADPQYPKKRS